MLHPRSSIVCTHCLELKKYIQEQLNAGLIKESKFPYTTPIFYIKKKNGSFWPIFDSRKINAITVKDTFPLPHINTIIKGARNKTRFMTIDLCNRYWNVCNSEVSEDILAFKTTRGLYAPKVMPFGLTNTPACMECFINHIFTPLHNKYPIYFENYMDDLTGEGKDELHHQIIFEFFKVLCNNHLFLWLAKCIFEKDKINFLGMHLNCYSITIDPSKIARLTDWPWTLRNVKEVQKASNALHLCACAPCLS